jgi:RNA polymerase sigma-70 factor (ECF subfamily)
MKTKQEKFELLFKQSQSKLYTVAFNVVRNKEVAEEVLQEAYIKAWKKFDDYDPGKKFENWMITIVKNAGIDANRANSKNFKTYSLNNISSQMSGDKQQKLSLDVVDKSADLSKMMESKELIQYIYNSVDNLPEELKVVMVPFIEGQSYNEISDSSNLAITTVRTRVHRAKKILRDTFKYEKSANF